MKINGTEIEFSAETPQEEGTFLWMGSLTKDLQVLNLDYKPACENYGIHWDGYYAVAQMRGRNVLALKGTFAKITDD